MPFRWPPARPCAQPRVSSLSRIRPGDTIELGIDTSNLHFFDPGSGLSIGRSPPAAAS